MATTQSAAGQAVPAPTTPAGRVLHPWAWWGWAIGIAVAANLTTNPLLLAVLIAAVVVVVLQRRTDAPWARSLRLYLVLALFIIGIRIVFQVVLGSPRYGTVLFTLPEVPLPDWMAGINLGGPVEAEGLLRTVYDGLRLVAILVCVAAATSLANPRKALKSVPAALYGVSVAVVIALTVAPQLVESVGRVRKARRLRGGKTKGLNAVRAIAVPVLAESMERSLSLAAGMESRGYGRTVGVSRATRITSSVSCLVGMVAIAWGGFLVLGGSAGIPGVALSPEVATAVAIGVGAALVALGLWLAGRGLRVTRYRPDPWRTPETLTLACGFGAALCLFDPFGWFGQMQLATPVRPLTWPELDVPMILAAVLAVAPGFFTPDPRPLRPRPVEQAAADDAGESGRGVGARTTSGARTRRPEATGGQA